MFPGVDSSTQVTQVTAHLHARAGLPSVNSPLYPSDWRTVSLSTVMVQPCYMHGADSPTGAVRISHR